MTVEQFFDQFLSNILNLRSVCEGEHLGENPECDICRVTSAHKFLAQELKKRLSIKPTDDEEKRPSTFLTGSYRRHTMNRPPQDVDFFILLDKYSYEDDELGELITPEKLLDILEKEMLVIASENGWTAQRQTHSVTMVYDEEFSVDVIPAFETDDEKAYLIPDDIKKEYLLSNPKTHFEIVNDLNKKTEKVNGKKRFKRLARIIKSMKESLFSEDSMKMRSFHLELMAAKIFEDGNIPSFSQGLEMFLRKSIKYLEKPGLVDPANEENLVDDYFIEKPDAEKIKIIDEFKALSDIASAALLLENQRKTNEAISAWGKVIPATATFWREEQKKASSVSASINQNSVYQSNSPLNVQIGQPSIDDDRKRIANSPSWGE